MRFSHPEDPEHIHNAEGRCVSWCPACQIAAAPAKQGELPKRSKPVWREFTADERKMALALGGCTFSVGSFDKRFARDVSARAAAPLGKISERQAALLPRMVYRYRRQIAPKVVALARDEVLHG